MKAVRHLTEETYFKHYEGQEPFIFISYAHADSAEVMIETVTSVARNMASP